MHCGSGVKALAYFGVMGYMAGVTEYMAGVMGYMTGVMGYMRE